MKSPATHDRAAGLLFVSGEFRQSIALPGGIGTMDEIFEVLSMLQLGLTAHPIGLLNVNGFYNVFVQLTEQLKATGFLKEKYAHIIIVRDTVQELLDALDAV